MERETLELKDQLMTVMVKIIEKDPERALVIVGGAWCAASLWVHKGEG